MDRASRPGSLQRSRQQMAARFLPRNGLLNSSDEKRCFAGKRATAASARTCGRRRHIVGTSTDRITRFDAAETLFSAAADLFRAACSGLRARRLAEWIHGNAVVGHFENLQLFGSTGRLQNRALPFGFFHQRAG